MHKTILHIGSNIGDRHTYLSFAIQRIAHRIGDITLLSKIYETEAWGGISQHPFLNQALEVETDLSADLILKKCQEIELEAERIREVKWGPRTLDIDLILYDNEIIESPELTIPHPRMQERNFVMVPVSEIAPHWIHPLLNESMEVLKEKSTDIGLITTYQE